MRYRQQRGSPKSFSKSTCSHELGAVVKDWGGRLPFALVYPNSYYIGMSNLGVHAIYKFLNAYNDAVCERVFWEKDAQRRRKPVTSLESGRPLTDFAVIAFSVSYELDYFNIAPILKTSGIPVYAKDRDERHPLIIAGGPCSTANPVPLAPFFDALAIGEAEPILPPLLDVLREGISEKRADLLAKIAKLPGMYVPMAYSGTPVARQWTQNLDEFPVHTVIYTPDTELGGMYLIEVERGCKWNCGFCLVSTSFKPMRYRSVANLMESARDGLKMLTRVGLMGADVSDYPYLEELLDRLRERAALISISSLRINRVSDKVLYDLVRGGAETITVAPEAGSERLRKLIRKGICEEDILQSIERIAKSGVKQAKLYFMVGLPQEIDEDIEEIIKLTLRCKDIIEQTHSPTRLILNISPFVPKAGTLFERHGMAPLDVLKRRIDKLDNELSAKGIEIKAESPAWSEIQAALARGDEKAADVLTTMDKMSLPAWRKAVAASGFDVDFYAHKEWDKKRAVPWEVVKG